MNNELENISEGSGRCLVEATPRNSQGEKKKKYENPEDGWCAGRD
jgi:hypothetical protein